MKGKTQGDWMSLPVFALAGIIMTLIIVFLWHATPVLALPDESPSVGLQALDQLFYFPFVAKQPGPVSGQYALIGWNDLGMHCYNRDFSDLAVLPPFNTLVAQVIRRGNPPQLVTQGIKVQYSFPDNTYSVGKSNFWNYEDKLFGVSLPNNIGLKGKGLAGEMDARTDHFVVEGIPLTEFSDSDLVNRQPLQLANLVVTGPNGEVLAQNTIVAPVSTEMTCDKCHGDNAIDGVTTGRIETNILTLHDRENSDEYPAGHQVALMNRRPVLCAECHASNALGAPGVSGLPNLSKAMHTKHAGKVPDTLDGCYSCHPGPQTRCLRDVMSTEHSMDCIDCHGGMAQVAQNPNPWLNEPRCDTCHEETPQDHVLYRESRGHGNVYCEACHDSPHAIATSREASDGIKFVNLQGEADTLSKCTVCHLTQPTGGGPHH